jgi:hypothetical protein
MIYLFDEFELDRSKVELRRNGVGYAILSDHKPPRTARA